jgi:hypothetical protein
MFTFNPKGVRQKTDVAPVTTSAEQKTIPGNIVNSSPTPFK